MPELFGMQLLPINYTRVAFERLTREIGAKTKHGHGGNTRNGSICLVIALFFIKFLNCYLSPKQVTALIKKQH